MGEQSWNSKRTRNHPGTVAGLERYFQQSIAGAIERAMDPSEVRHERVKRVRTAIAHGYYNVSSADVAQKLISAMRGEFR